MKTDKHFWPYLVRFLIEWKMYQEKRCRENQNTHFVFSIFISKTVGFMR